jgi:hypothetical protein
MKRPKPSDLFEQRIHRVHELLEGEGATVTWDEHLSDPDNAEQPRQIDVTVRRDGAVTLVECRIHRRPQDVQWIEELIGRRISLNAVGVVAVSSSGFTEGARRKAAAHQVELRDLAELSDDDVRSWGRSVAVSFLCYQYSDLALTMSLIGDPPEDRAVVASALRGHPLLPVSSIRRPTT